MTSKPQLSPRIAGKLAEVFRWFVKYTNDGSYKGRLADEVTKGLKLRLGTYFLKHPERRSDVPEGWENIVEGAIDYTEQEMKLAIKGHDGVSDLIPDRDWESERSTGIDQDVVQEINRRLGSLKGQMEDFEDWLDSIDQPPQAGQNQSR